MHLQGNGHEPGPALDVRQIRSNRPRNNAQEVEKLSGTRGIGSEVYWADTSEISFSTKMLYLSFWMESEMANSPASYRIGITPHAAANVVMCYTIRHPHCLSTTWNKLRELSKVVAQILESYS